MEGTIVDSPSTQEEDTTEYYDGDIHTTKSGKQYKLNGTNWEPYEPNIWDAAGDLAKDMALAGAIVGGGLAIGATRGLAAVPIAAALRTTAGGAALQFAKNRLKAYASGQTGLIAKDAIAATGIGSIVESVRNMVK